MNISLYVFSNSQSYIKQIKISTLLNVFLLDVRRPVCLPPKDYSITAETYMAVTGWGYRRENGEKSYM